MYKYLLCWRYLRTRYIALASIISVMLGVATMIVVNAVMEGFTHEMKDRIHGILSDLVFESQSMDGFPDADRRMAEIRNVAGDYIAGMSPTINIPAMLGYSYGSQYITKQIMMIGVDDATYASVGDFGNYLQHPDNRKQLDFKLKDGGYDTRDHQASDPSKAAARDDMKTAGWEIRRRRARFFTRVSVPDGTLDNPFAMPKKASADSPGGNAALVGGAAVPEATEFDPTKDQHTGCVLGIGLCGYRLADGSESFLALPGDDVEISYPTSSKPPKVLSAKFTCVDFYESKMNEFDSNFVFVPIRKLQELRGMIDPSSGIANCNAINIRLKPGVDLDMVRDLLRSSFPPQVYRINTWREKQGALLAAVQMETIVLNILLFLIIAVAGFGILAIFFMIVFEKTRDIGIMKSLGAHGMGILGIFICYGLCLGIVGAGVGLGSGLLIVHYIDKVADFVSFVMRQPVFDPSIYYFQKIPTIVDGFTVALVVFGAVLIAVIASIIPAIRAALLHPVEALRYE
jgi:lipoprotein-releasing system permease protein